MKTSATTLAAMMMFGACGSKQPTEAPAAGRTAVIEKAPAEAPAKKEPPPIEAAVKPEAKPEPAPTAAPEAKPEPAPTAAPEAKPEPAPTAAPEAKPAPAVEPEAKPAPAPEPEPAGDGGAGTEALAPELEVTDAAITDAIVDRMPGARRTTWKAGEDAKLIGWFELKNPSAPVDLELVWRKDGKENWRFPTNVGKGKNWRTWAEKRIGKRDAGRWTLELVDANGHVYKKISYTVE